MWGLGSTGWRAVTAFLRCILVCVVLAVVSAQSHHAFASENGHVSVTSMSAHMATSGPDHHSEDSCKSAGHCSPAFVGIAPSVSVAIRNWRPVAFVFVDAPPLHGWTVDPGQHPPKSTQLF